MHRRLAVTTFVPSMPSAGPINKEDEPAALRPVRRRPSVQQTLLARGQRAGTSPARTHAQLPDRLTLGKPKSSPSSQQE